MTPTPEQRLKRALWLAFQASSAMGMGYLHASTASAATEDSLWKDYGDSKSIYTDYAHGRMMKTSFKLSDDGTVSISPEEPRLDYQSWGAHYGSATELLKAVEESFRQPCAP